MRLGRRMPSRSSSRSSPGRPRCREVLREVPQFLEDNVRGVLNAVTMDIQPHALRSPVLGGDWNPPSWCACDSCIDSVSIVFSGFPLSFLLLCNFHPSVQPQPPTNPPPSNQPAANQGWASLFVAVFRCLLYIAVFRCPMLASVCLAVFRLSYVRLRLFLAWLK